MRKIGNIICFVFISFLFCSCSNNKNPSDVQIKKIDYSSASAIEYFDGKLYVMGDDATNLIVLDTNLNIIDSIPLFSYPGSRIPKAIKHDIESILFLKDSSKFLLLSSGSLSPYRDTAWIIDPVTKQKNSISLTNYYQYLKKSGSEELNIEGATSLNQYGFVFANRGHLGWPKNQLIFTSHLFLPGPGDNAIMPVRFISDSITFRGISGLAYAALNDALIMTVSTEATKSSFEDGAIGKSYIWIIKKAGAITGIRELKPDVVIELESLNKAFKGQKIESATVIKETKESLRIVLVADNDDGTSTIFKMSIENIELFQFLR
jgi:hypothetical protein